MEELDKFKYLGVSTNGDGGKRKEVTHRFQEKESMGDDGKVLEGEFES